MKVGILTFHCAANYGAVLQAYALQEILKSMGHEVFILDYRPNYITKIYRAFNFRKSIAKNNFIREFLRTVIYYPRRLSRLKHFKNFNSTYLNLLSFERFSDLDAIIVGSDQVWSPSLDNNNFHKKYFLDFDIPKSIYKISYAVSAGDSDLFERKMNPTILNLIKNFNSLSVRENSLSETLSKLSNGTINPKIVLDPVMLCGPEYFKPFISKKFIPKKKYIFAFSLFYDENLIRIAEDYAHKNNLIIIKMASMDDSFKDNLLKPVSIQQFLSLIFYAEAIFTSSFHGTVFSIIFNKQFYVSPSQLNHSKRINDLLKISGLYYNENVSSLDSKFADSNLLDIDYAHVNNQINYIRNESIGFLKSALISKY